MLEGTSLATAPMTESAPLRLRPMQLGDLDAVETIFADAFQEEYGSRLIDIRWQIQRLRRWYGPLKVLSTFPNRFQHLFTVHVAEQDGQIKGVIQVSPFNQSRTTWRVDHIAVATDCHRQGIGSRLLRHCMEHFREARTWILEVNIHNKGAMALYRHNGFQPLAQITYWSLVAEHLAELAAQDREIPNVLLVGRGDAQRIYQLDTVSMPPQVRQIYDRHSDDFRPNLLEQTLEVARQAVSKTERVQAYVYEPERQAAIGYFNLRLSTTGAQPHVAQLTVHPAYTWLYPDLLARMAKLTQVYPAQALYLASTDYQPEREAWLLKLGATELERTLLMSRSVWHKLRESRFSLDNLPLHLMLRTLQGSQPMPERIDLDALGDTLHHPLQADQGEQEPGA
ncbi:MAG: GNAT family N-acetyltransferase [Synechococcales cyanobacterium]